MNTVIGTYNYTYGVGDEPNRQIQFSRTGLHPRTIQAKVFVLRANAIGSRIATLQGDQISVEIENTMAKIISLIRGKNLDSDRNLGSFSIQQQKEIIRSFKPGGPKSIEVESEGNPYGIPEIVLRLKIFDPS